MFLTKLLRQCTLIALVSVCTATVCEATPTFSVSFADPDGAFAAFYDPIRTDVLAAGAEWGEYLQGTANISVEVHFTNEATASGTSTTSSFVRQEAGLNVFEQGAAAKLHGVPLTVVPDAVLNIGANYLQNELWFDPSPLNGQPPSIPLDKTDATSVFLHEFGHIFAFSGWKDPRTGLLPGNYESTFDARTAFIDGQPYFVGSQAMQVYGGAVPLTMNDGPWHLGNPYPGPGADLIGDLMNGVVTFRGTRYNISPLDLAILQDAGVTIVPEPATALLVGTGLLALWRNTYKARDRQGR